MENINNYLSDLMTNHYYEYNSESDNDLLNIQSGGNKSKMKGGLPLVRQCEDQKRNKIKIEKHKKYNKKIKVENSINIGDIIRIKRNNKN